MLLSFYDYLLDCPFKKYLGIECLGCGFQRSVVLLFQGNFIDSIKMYPATIPMVILWIYVIAHLVFKFKNGARNILYAFIFCVVLISINYGYKIFQGTIY